MALELRKKFPLIYDQYEWYEQAKLAIILWLECLSAKESYVQPLTANHLWSLGLVS